MDKPRILIVDDEETIRHILVNVISWNNCEVREAGTAEDGLALLSEFTPDVALLDIVMPGKNGLELLKEIKQRSPDTEVVMMTSHASAETALRAMREGAYTYLQKPFENLDEIWTTLQRALEKRNLTVKKRSLLDSHDERSRKMESAVAIVDAGAAGAESSASSELLDYFMDMITDELGVDNACILLLDEPAGLLRSVSRRTEGTRDPTAATVKVGEGICGGVAGTGAPFLLAKAAEAGNGANGGPPAGDDALLKAPIALCVPIKSDRRIVGVFAAGPRVSGEAYGEADVAHLVALGSQLAVALEGTQRASRLEKAYETLKATQEQLVRTERLKAVGQLAAGVAHDFNNLLSVILGRAEMLHDHLQKDGFARDRALADIDGILKAGRQAAQAIKRIQDYTRTRKDQPSTPVDLNAAVRDAIEIAKPKWKQDPDGKGTRISIELQLAEVGKVIGNALELAQAVENLIFNAVDAMPKGGAIAFRTHKDGDSVILEVSDTGVGMSDETQKRLFEPFFTTKESGQGLGTSIVYGIVERHGGRISVESQVGVGTTFRIVLPAYVEPAKDSSQPVAPAAAAARNARILLVDDEEAVRGAYQAIIASAGHDVTSAASGEQAVAFMGRAHFDLVITDLSMRGMSGYQVATAVRLLDPSIRVILLTGLAVDPGSEQVRRSGIDRVLTKPCSTDEMREAIRRVLDTGAAATN